MHLNPELQRKNESVYLDLGLIPIPRYKHHPALSFFGGNTRHKAVKSHLVTDIDITLPQATKAITRPGLGTAETP